MLSQYRRPTIYVSLFALPIVFAACSASQPDSDPETGTNPAGDGDGESPQSVDSEGNVCGVVGGRSLLRRLTVREYQASLQALLGTSDFPEGDPLTGNTAEGAYSTRAEGLWVRDLGAQTLANHANEVGEWVAANIPSAATSCTELSEACARETVRTLGRQAFRAPLSDAQVDRHAAVFLAGDSFEEGLAMVVSTLIQSPYFLYRRELGTSQGEVASLSDHELGSALAYFLTGLPPDAELEAVIDSGLLREQAEWDSQVDRLLDSPRAEQQLFHFVMEWLELEDVLTRTKTEADFLVTDKLREVMVGEVEALVRNVAQTEGGVAELLYNESVFLNAQLGAHYGLRGVTTPTHEPIPAGDRLGGVLGTGAYLLAHSTVETSSPTLRGLYIRERLLCQEVLPPPPTVDTELPVISAPSTTRERYANHLTNPTCSTCHGGFDPLGFALEAFDGLGRYRTEENGIPVDTSGEMVGLESGALPLDGPVQLAQTLADSEQVSRCFHQHLTEYLVGQESWDKLCSVNSVMQTSMDRGGSLKETLRAIVSLPHLTTRSAQGGL